MKKTGISLLVLFFLEINSFAQQDTIAFSWVPKAAIGAGLSQISFTNWQRGGEDALAWTLNGNGSLYYKSTEWHIRNDLRVAFGKAKIGSSDFRTTDNDLYFETVLAKRIGWDVDPYFSTILRTALTTGYNYKVDPAVSITDFFDPAYLSQSLGFTFGKIPGLTSRLGVAVQEIIAKKYTQYTDDNTTSYVEKVKIETGIESVTSAEYKLMDNIVYKSKLHLFSRFETLNIWNVRWDNTITASVNKFVNVTIVFLLVYDEDQVRKTQIKETLQLGVTYNIF